jgi:1-acyl-sn-glycerol-3-phosphate acyltransferase
MPRAPMNPMEKASAYLRHILFYLCVALWITLCILGGFFLLLLPQRYLMDLGTLFCRGVLVLASWFLGITHQVHGLENLPHGPCIVASKHQSTWETMALTFILRRPTFVMKSQLLAVPIIGTFLKKVDMIGVSRGQGGSQRPISNAPCQSAPNQSPSDTAPAQNNPSFLAQAARITGTQGRPIVIFPEGTRTHIGQTTRYRQGVALLAQHLQLPVIPVALNSGLFWPRNTFLKTPGTIHVVFLPPISPDLAPEIILQRLKSAIEQTCLALVH